MTGAARLPAAALLLAALLALLLPAAGAAAGDRRAADPAPPSRAEVMGRTLDILNRPEFAGSEEDEEGLLLLLSNMLSDLVDGVKRLRTRNPLLYGTIVGWLVATLVAIVGHVAWTVWRSGGRSGPPGRAPSASDPALATRAGRDPARMLSRAGAEAAAGRHADAVPWLYLALLFRLERAGHLRFDAARTALEYADELARRPGSRASWTAFLDRHDPVVFGRAPCTPEEFERLRALALAPIEGGGRG